MQISDIMSPVSTRRLTSLLRLFLLLPIYLFATVASADAQTAGAPGRTLEPGPKPPDVSAEWKQLVGIYGQVKESSNILLERDGLLLWRSSDGKESRITPIEGNRYSTFTAKTNVPQTLTVHPDVSGSIPSLTINGKVHSRADAGSDPSHFYHVTPSRPLEQLHSEAVKASPPHEAGPFRKPDLVEIATLDPAFQLDIRYAQSNNFLSTPVYSQARAFMQRPAAEALVWVLHKLQSLGYGLLLHDAYRPWYVTKIFWDATPPEGHIFVADPAKGSKHNRGCAVDITLYDLATGQPIEMPGLYDEMSPRSFPTFPGGTSLQRWHRDLLRRAMESEGFTVNKDEWWHFDYKDWKQYPILNVPFEKLAPG
jgi:D-alanyl-D-alanine dipeptidase